MLDIRSYVIIIIVIKEIIVSMGKNLSFSNIIRFYQNYFTKMSHNQLHCPKVDIQILILSMNIFAAFKQFNL